MPDVTHSQHLDRFSCTDLPKDANVDPAEVSQKGGILLANPRMSLYCTVIRLLLDSTKINSKTWMAGV